jgi:hypothetical protein
LATVDRQHDALQTIFSFFLGLMVVAFIGVGVNTFYQTPSEKYQTQMQSLNNQSGLIYAKGSTLTAEDQAALAQIQQQTNDLQTRIQVESENWGRNTSIILVLFATLAMGISLIRSDQLKVVSNGLLLGGLFTMIYGAGWTIVSGTSYLRFFVVLFALAVAIALGYAKFVWLHKEEAPPVAGSVSGASLGAGPGVASGDVAGLAARVAALEAKTNAAAAALGRRESA